MLFCSKHFFAHIKIAIHINFRVPRYTHYFSCIPISLQNATMLHINTYIAPRTPVKGVVVVVLQPILIRTHFLNPFSAVSFRPGQCESIGLKWVGLGQLG